MDDRRQQLEMQLSAYLDNELSPRERQEVEALLATDESVRALLEQLRATIEAVHALPRLKASEQLIESLRARMERQSLLDTRPAPVHVAAPGRSYFRWTAAAAVIALTATAGYMMWGLGQDRLGETTRIVATNDRPKDTPAIQPRGAVADLGKEHDDSVPAPELDKGKRTLELAIGGKGEPAGAKGTAADRQNVPALVTDPVPPIAAKELAYGQSLGDNAENQPAINESAANLDMAGGGFVAGIGGAGLTPLTTVVELTFADADAQQQAARFLRDEYGFQPTEPPVQAGETTEFFAKYVPNAESARDIVEGVKQSASLADGVSVVVSNYQETPQREPADDLTLSDHTALADKYATLARRAGTEARAKAAAPALAETVAPPPAAAPPEPAPSAPEPEGKQVTSPPSPGLAGPARAAKRPATSPTPADTLGKDESARGRHSIGKPAARGMAAGRLEPATQPDAKTEERLAQTPSTAAAAPKQAGSRMAERGLRNDESAEKELDTLGVPAERPPTSRSSSFSLFDNLDYDFLEERLFGLPAPRVIRLYVLVDATATSPPAAAAQPETAAVQLSPSAEPEPTPASTSPSPATQPAATRPTVPPAPATTPSDAS